MAQPVAQSELGSWRGEGVRLGQVLDALGDLRRCEQRTATRASVTNLVLVARDDDEVERACDAVHRLGRRHPGRNIVLLPRPDAEPAGIDAEVLLHGSVLEGGHPVWSEDVRLVARGAAATHLGSLIEPLTLPDLAVAVWFVSGLPDPHDPLVAAASAVVVDSATLDGGQGSVAGMARLAGRRVVLDLCWTRLRPWRQLLAGLFEVPAARPFVAGVRKVAVGGPPWPRLLLGGWAASRLGLPVSVVEHTPGPTPAVSLVAEHAGEVATFSVEQARGAGGAALVRATSSLGTARVREDRLSLPEDPLASSLGEVLTRMTRDRAHGQALQVAVGFTM